MVEETQQWGGQGHTAHPGDQSPGIPSEWCPGAVPPSALQLVWPQQRTDSLIAGGGILPGGGLRTTGVYRAEDPVRASYTSAPAAFCAGCPQLAPLVPPTTQVSPAPSPGISGLWLPAGFAVLRSESWKEGCLTLTPFLLGPKCNSDH